MVTAIMTADGPVWVDAATVPGPATYRTHAANAARRDQGTARRVAILAELARRESAGEPPPSWVELDAALGTAYGTARYHCGAMVAAGLVAYDAGRARTLRLTAAGRAMLAGQL